MKKSDFIPPIIHKALSRYMSFRSPAWSGNFQSWDEALKNAGGYDELSILEKVKQATLKVKRGEAAYERDSVLFDKLEYDWPMVSSLMWVAAQSGYLDVMDFGGSLGSTYFQNQHLLKEVKNLHWNIVEQPHFVKCGKEHLQDERLRFYDDLDSCIKDNRINIIILSSVLPYLSNPYGLLEKLKHLDVKYVVIDKMPFIESGSDRITVQKVPDWIYKASYPAWFFSRKKFYDFIENHFQVVFDFDRNVPSTIPSVFKGMLLVKKPNA